MALGPVGGAALRFGQGLDGLVLGIEDALSVRQVTARPCWASAPFLRLLVLPAEVAAVVIYADADPDGIDAAYDAARRFVAEGRDARVAIPRGVKDLNERLLRARAVQ
jgi:hypothetical protein